MLLGVNEPVTEELSFGWLELFDRYRETAPAVIGKSDLLFPDVAERSYWEVTSKKSGRYQGTEDSNERPRS